MTRLAILLVVLVAACGDATEPSGGDVEPTPSFTPMASPTPSGPACGNGAIDAGEVCDGEDFCTTECRIADLGGCWDSELTGLQLCSAQEPSGSLPKMFTYGARCEGVRCPMVADCFVGRCMAVPLERVSICCQRADGGCEATVVEDTIGLGQLTGPNGCELTGRGLVVVGTCGADGSCVPRGRSDGPG